MQKQTNIHDFNLDENEIDNVICHVALLWRRLIGIRIKSLKVSITEKRVLYCILRHPGLTQVQIAKKLDLEPQNLLRTLDKLEKKNWISKCNDSNDRRIKCLKVTPESKKIILKMDKITSALKEEVLSGIDNKNIKTTLKHLAGLRKNLLDIIEKE